MTRLLILAFLIASFHAAVSAAPVPKKDSTGQLLVAFDDGTLSLIDPDGKINPREILLRESDGRPRQARLSPDGKRIALTVPAKEPGKFQFILRDVAGDGVAEVLHTVQHSAHCFFSPDGKFLFGSGLDMEAAKNPNKPRHECWINWSIDLGTGKIATIDLGGEYRIIACDAGGTRFAAIRTFELRPVGGGVMSPRVESRWVDCKTLKSEIAIPAEVDVMAQFPFPDGQRWFVRIDAGKETLDRFGIYDAKAPTPASMEDVPKNSVRHVALSPDGLRLAYSLNNGEEDQRLVVAGANGRNPIVVSKSRATIVSIDWR